jgi:hypothetical protein
MLGLLCTTTQHYFTTSKGYIGMFAFIEKLKFLESTVHTKFSKLFVVLFVGFLIMHIMLRSTPFRFDATTMAQQ